MAKHETHEQITARVEKHISKHFRGSNAEFYNYVGVNSGNFYRMLNGHMPWCDAVLSAIGYEREKLAYVRRGK